MCKVFCSTFSANRSTASIWSAHSSPLDLLHAEEHLQSLLGASPIVTRGVSSQE